MGNKLLHSKTYHNGHLGLYDHHILSELEIRKWTVPVVSIIDGLYCNL